MMRGVGVEVDRMLRLARDAPDAAADVDLPDRAADVDESARHPDRRSQRTLEGDQPVGQPAGAGMEVERVDDQAVSPRGRQRVVEPVGGDAELRRARAGIGQTLVVAGTDHGVDAQADGRARRSPADPLDLADRVEVEMHAGAEDDVEVALRAVRAGVRDLGGRPAVGDGVLDLAGRAGVDADRLGLTSVPRGRAGPPGPPAPGWP